MRCTIIIFLLAISTISFGQAISYSAWKEEAKSNIRLLPQYGGAEKTQEQKSADQELIDAYTAQEGSRRKGSELLVKLGFDYLYRGDLKTAMYRFNQAWILDSGNANAYWGFGAVYFSFGDFDNAQKQYDQGLKIDENSTNILTDKATIYMTSYMNGENESDYNQALTLFRKSYSIDSKNPNTLFKLSVCYFVKKDCGNAWKYYNECQKLGGHPITKEYTEALAQGCKK
ncbi:tetratricopeptide repeat protein [Arcticibacter tournemirensis]